MGIAFHHSRNCRQVFQFPVLFFLDLSHIPDSQVSFPVIQSFARIPQGIKLDDVLAT